MALTLRPYQLQCIAEAREHLRVGRRSVLIQGATGSGKTALSAHMISSAHDKGLRSWFAVHRRELVNQSVATLENSANLNVGVIAAGFGSNGYPRVQVASIQTLFRRWKRFPLPDLLILDECHHAISTSWSALLREILHASPKTKLIGLTATPQRLDGRGLQEWFDVMVQGPPVASLIADGFLSPYKLFAPTRLDLRDVHSVAGDYNKRELDVAMMSSKVTGDAIHEYKTRCMGKRALMFLWSVKASEEMAADFNAQGIPAAHLDGATHDYARDRVVKDFRDGKIKVLTNCEIVTEGFDLPAIEACFLLRPTQSLGLYLQMVGRALRPYPGKPYALLMDHANLAFTHGLPDDLREWSLQGAETTTEKRKQESPVRQCMKCYGVMTRFATKCKYCGHVFESLGRKVQHEDGELQEITSADMEGLWGSRMKRQEQGSAESLEDLRRIEKQRGYKRGWAQHVYAARMRKAAERNPLSVMADTYRPKERT